MESRVHFLSHLIYNSQYCFQELTLRYVELRCTSWVHNSRSILLAKHKPPLRFIYIFWTKSALGISRMGTIFKQHPQLHGANPRNLQPDYACLTIWTPSRFVIFLNSSITNLSIFVEFEFINTNFNILKWGMFGLEYLQIALRKYFSSFLAVIDFHK